MQTEQEICEDKRRKLIKLARKFMVNAIEKLPDDYVMQLVPYVDTAAAHCIESYTAILKGLRSTVELTKELSSGNPEQPAGRTDSQSPPATPSHTSGSGQPARPASRPYVDNF